MEKSRNTGFCGGGEDEERHSNESSVNIDRFLQDPVPSVGIQNILEINQIQTAVEAKSMAQLEPGQPQPADISTADSHSGKITEAEKIERKRKSDQKYRNKVKEDQKRLKSTAETFEAENERLKQENDLVKQQLEAKSKEFDLLKKNYDQQCENEQQMKSAMESLKADNECLKNKLDDLKNKLYELNLKKFEEEQRMKSLLDENGLLNTEKRSLEEENALVKQRFEAKSKKLVELGNDFDKLKQKYNKLRGKKRGLKLTLKTLEEENRLKAATIKSLIASLEEVSKHSGELVRLRSKLANLELAPATSSTKSQSVVRRSTNFIGGFGQYGHNWERTKGVGQLSQSQPARFPVAQAVQLQVDLDKELGNSIKLMIV